MTVRPNDDGTTAQRWFSVEGTVVARPETTRQGIYRQVLTNVTDEYQLDGDVITLAFICEPNDR
ncbi:hypothetical protein ACFWJ5_21195 [Streptomyces qaidamensis]|uniref:hypothetical protein n=1 Tax=Streptomyces qaidamensis TaxID=1783515 RepID=UPI00365A19A3